MLLARIYEVFPLICPSCNQPMRIISFITETDVIEKILTSIGEPIQLPILAEPRGPPLWELDQTTTYDGEGIDPLPEEQYDQSVAW